MRSPIWGAAARPTQGLVDGQRRIGEKVRAAQNDTWIQFVDLMWQRANWPEVGRTIQGIDYFHLLATSVAKLRHFFEARETIGQGLISSFVQTELEYLITVARSVFDLLEALATIWSQRVRLIDPTRRPSGNNAKCLIRSRRWQRMSARRPSRPRRS
jgi:hypothetical protein